VNYTPKYGFKKPEGNESVGPAAFNDNMDAIEGVFETKADLVNGQIPGNQLPTMDYAPSKTTLPAPYPDVAVPEAVPTPTLITTILQRIWNILFNAYMIASGAKTKADEAIPKSNIAAATGGTLPVSRGGTGGTTAALGRAGLELGAASTGAFPITVAQGGTGGTTAALARAGLGLGVASTGAFPLTLAQGGTNATDAANARTQLGITNANLGAMPLAGGTFTGAAIAQTNANYTTRQVRNVVMSTADPSGGANGDIWLKYT